MKKKKIAFLPIELVAADFIMLQNYVWEHSFAIVKTIKKAIYDRGWFPCNWNLLLHPESVATITKEGKNAAKDNDMLRPKLCNLSIIGNSSTAPSPNYDPLFLSLSQNSAVSNNFLLQLLYFESSMAYSYVECLIGHETLMQKKEEMKSKK